MLHALVKSNDPAKVNVLYIPDDPSETARIQRYNRADLRLEGEVSIPRVEGLREAAKYAEERERAQVEFEALRKMPPELRRGIPGLEREPGISNETRGPLERDEELLNKLFPNRVTERLTLIDLARENDREGEQRQITIDGRKPYEAEVVSTIDGREMYKLQFSRSGAFALAADAAEYAYGREREKSNDKNKQNDPDRKKEEEKLENLQKMNPKLLVRGCKDVVEAMVYLDLVNRMMENAAQEQKRLEKLSEINPNQDIQAQYNITKNAYRYFSNEQKVTEEKSVELSKSIEKDLNIGQQNINQKDIYAQRREEHIAATKAAMAQHKAVANDLNKRVNDPTIDVLSEDGRKILNRKDLDREQEMVLEREREPSKRY